jgi:HEAT repeat protein
VKWVAAAVTEGRVQEAFETTVGLLRESEGVTDEQQRRAYTIALQRIATPENLARFGDLVADDLYAADAVRLMRFAGPKGTQVLLDKLVAAASFAERRKYLAALRSVESGIEIIISMFGHHEWYVVRNMADLVGELRLEEAVPALSRVAGHPDARVRRSVGVALARIGTGAAATPLRALLRDRDREVRLAVAQAVSGRALGALVMPLVAAAEAEEDSEILCEYYRATGRIGTPEAVQVLAKAAQSAGSLFKRRAVAPRLAAIEALAATGTAAARSALVELANDRDRQIREAAQEALQRAEAAPATEG